MNDTLLMNFRISRELKERFQDVCEARRTTMTAELTRYLLDVTGNLRTKSTKHRTWESHYAD